MKPDRHRAAFGRSFCLAFQIYLARLAFSLTSEFRCRATSKFYHPHRRAVWLNPRPCVPRDQGSLLRD